MMIKNSRFVFRPAYFFTLAAALFLSFVLLTGCGKTEDGGSEITPSSSESVQTADGQEEQGESGSDASGFVIEDTSTVEVDIDEE